MEITLNDKISKIIDYCLAEKDSINPIKIAINLMNIDGISMHGVEHHFLDGAAFMTAMHNAEGQFDLLDALTELTRRALKMPGAMCGYWGICGSTASIGAVFSILHGTSPLSNDEYYKNNMEYSAKVLLAMSKIGGARCCKRNAFISILAAIDFASEKYGVKLDKETVKCTFYKQNQQCIKNRCPFFPE